jgi:hypothetical protein
MAYPEIMDVKITPIARYIHIFIICCSPLGSGEFQLERWN